MLTRIVHQSPDVLTFFEGLGLPLTEPQKRHLINLADGILVTEGKKTLANIQRRDHDDGHIDQERIRSQALAALKTNHAWHHHIEQDQVRGEFRFYPTKRGSNFA